MIILIERLKHPQQSSSVTTEELVDYLEKKRRIDRENARRKKLQQVKINLPLDKEKLDMPKLNDQVALLLSDPLNNPEVYELLEMEYYLDHPKIKTTDQFAEHIRKTRHR
jgi:hypothetical protein